MMTKSGGFSLRTRVARSIFWLAWSRGVVQLFSFATTVLVARILVPADYGIMALASMFIGTAGVLAEMGLGGAIVQFRDLDRRELDTCFWIIVTLSAIAYAVLALGAPAIADWFAVPRLADVLPVLGLGLPLNACTVVSSSLLRKRLALDQVSQAEIIGALVTLPVVLSCALAGFGVWALVIGSLVSWLARDAVILAFAPWLPGLRIGGERAKEMLHFSLTTFGVSILWALREQADVAVIGKITGQVTVGLYSMAKDLAMLPTAKISSVVYALSSPIMAELQTDIAAMRSAFFRALRLTAAITFPASAGMALVADDMIAVLLGPKWLPAVTVLRLLCLYAAVRAVEVLLPPVLVARRRQGLLFWYFLALFLAVPFAAALGTLWGGAPGAVLLLTPVYCGLIAIVTKRTLAELNGRLSDLWSETWPILAATSAMAAAVLLLREIAFSGRTEPSLFELILSAVFGAVTYLGALFAFGRTLIGEGTEVVGWMLRRRHGLD
jgi:O-antigen/teichoic acid export membrane protein